MSKFESLAEAFFKSMQQKKHFSIVEKLGLQDTTINLSKIPTNQELDFSIKEIYVFNKEGVLILNTKFKTFIEGQSSSSGQANANGEINFTKLNKLIKNMYAEKHEPVKSNQVSKDANTPRSNFFTSQYNFPFTASYDNFQFNKIFTNNQKVFFLSKNNLVFVGIFGHNTNSYLIKLYLLHMFTAFLNFIGENVEMIFNSKQDDIITSKNLDRSFNYITKDYFQIKIFEGKKSKKIIKNEKLWQEIRHHSHVLMSQYKSENQRKYDASNSYYNFVKVECTSTYPRLTFIIKFLPILNGISLIHVYSQNKLSRYNDTETTVSHLKNYKEIDIIYGSDIKNSTNIEFRYTEPKKLKEIEKFFLEFYSSTINKLDLFYNSGLDLKYFDNFLILTIDEIINQNKKISCDSLFTKINTRFYEMFLGDNQNERQKTPATGYSPNVLNTGNTNYYQEIMTDSNLDNINTEGGHNLPVNTNFMNINRQFILKEIYANNNFTSIQANMGSMSSMKPGLLLSSNNLPLNSVENNSYLLTKNEKDNTLILSNMNINDNHSRINPAEYDVSFDFARQLSEISHMDNDEENNNLTTYYKGFPSMNTMNFNPTESMDIMMTDLEKNQLRTENASSKNKCPTNFMVSPIKPPKFKPEINVTKSLSKLQKSISNIDNRLGVQSHQNPRKNSYTRSNSPNFPPGNKTQSSKVDNNISGNRGKSQDNLKDLIKADPANFIQNDHSLNVSVTFKSKIQLNTLKKDISDPLDTDADNIPLKLETVGVYRDRDKGIDTNFNENANAANNHLTEANLQVIYHNNVILESEPKLDQPNVIGNEHTTFR